jgi:hypothetical protein
MSESESVFYPLSGAAACSDKLRPPCMLKSRTVTSYQEYHLLREAQMSRFFLVPNKSGKQKNSKSNFEPYQVGSLSSVFIVSSNFSGILKISLQERVYFGKDLLNKDSFFGRLKSGIKDFYTLVQSSVSALIKFIAGLKGKRNLLAILNW